jgi:hypothetical protein
MGAHQSKALAGTRARDFTTFALAHAGTAYRASNRDRVTATTLRRAETARRVLRRHA